MTPLVLDINLINPAFHKKDFSHFINLESIKFLHITGWRDYLLTLQIHSAKVPSCYADAYHVALRIMLLAWADASLIKPAELQTLRSLESALIGVYFQPVFEREQAKREKVRKKCDGCKKCLLCATLVREKFQPGLDKFLDYMVAHDDLDPAVHNESKKTDRSALSIIRNALAHDDLFNHLSWDGLFEAVREVMEHAYRNRSLTQTRTIL
ncbi:conserved hypothetical protein [mine drainage metagenome]|uniref:Uncharacterized protein n=1 Tax=mine drainage metagenome TaxID=410659 RepID=A0A3P3ZRY0_9ZZZZ